LKHKSKTLRKLPTLKTDRQAAGFIGRSDLTQFDLSSLNPSHFEFSPKEARINMRVPGQLLDAVKVAAKRRGVPYQRFIRQALERALSAEK
jgi:predicted DNA binding CopG/RHH family protein